MSTESTEAVYDLFRAHLLAFEGSSGASLADRFGTRLYKVRAPDNVTYPYGVLRFLPRVTQGAYNMDRQEGYLELMLYDRPAKNAAALELDGDIVEQAMLRFRNTDMGGGLVFCRDLQRDTIPVPPPDMQRDIVSIRFLLQAVIWARYITDYATS